jgi:hypothetical protein
MSERERVEEVRLFLGFNKTKFSKILGYSTPQSYTNYLSSGNNLSMKMVKALKAYDSRISLDWLLEGQGQMLLSSGNLHSHKIINGNNNHAHIGDNTKSNINSNNSNTTDVVSLKKEIEGLKKEIKSQDKVIKSQEKLIAMLEKNQK